jgi:predicted SnoaL-like aldol condensation-catalyzing enzyme
MQQLTKETAIMSTDIEDNKTLVRRFFAAIEAGDLDVFDEIVADGYDDHLPGQQPGRENLKKYFGGLRAAFHDITLPIMAMVAEGNLVAVLNSVRGTHQGDFGGLKAKGSKVDAAAFQLYRVENGQLAEHWEVADYMTLFKQMQGGA